MKYKELYTQAWNDWTFHWKMGGIEASYLIETSVVDGYHEALVYAYVRNQTLVHKFSEQTEELMWEFGVRELLKAGAIKIYEGMMMLRREQYKREGKYKGVAEYEYPLSPHETFPPKAEK